MKMRETVNENPLLAILRNVPDEILLEYADAIVAGGVNFFEVALNSDGAYEQIARLRDHFGDSVRLGAGTAITLERARAAISAGAEFLLSPSTNEDVLELCACQGIPMLPGALTPTDVSVCVRYGFDTIKLFPAADMPMSYVKHLKGPFDGTEYVAIGGVNADNMADFIKHGYIGVGLGSNILPKDAVAARDWCRATEYVEKLLRTINEAKSKGGRL